MSTLQRGKWNAKERSELVMGELSLREWVNMLSQGREEVSRKRDREGLICLQICR